MYEENTCAIIDGSPSNINVNEVDFLLLIIIYGISQCTDDSYYSKWHLI